MLRKVLALFRPEAQHGLVMVLEKVGGGVHKRVDENRELVELLRKKAPALLQEFPWAEDWLRSNDEVFTALGRLATSLGANNPQFAAGPGFPRSWPESCTSSAKDSMPIVPATPSQRWIDNAYPLQKVTVHLQGTRHSNREDIISQLEGVLERLRAGDLVGEDHDDDYGYRFTVEPSSAGPSFFDTPAGYV